MNEQQKKQAIAAFQAGSVFVESALRSMAPVQVTATEFVMPITAGIVNVAFANELFLKSLLLVQGRSERGHALKELFKKLDPEMQAVIREDCALFTGHTASHFNAGLTKASKAFEELRYHWERLDDFNIDILVLMALAFACIKALRDADLVQPGAGSEHIFSRLLDQSPNREALVS